MNETRTTQPATPAPVPAQKIHCIGDSHVSFFAGQDTIQPEWPQRSNDLLSCFETHHLGPALAYNLPRPGTQTRGRERLFEVLEQAVPPGARVLLCFGEIDCRAHVWKQAAQHGKAMAAVVADCLEHYFQVVREVQARGFPVVIYNAVPSAITRRGKSRRTDEYAAVGDVWQRNAAIRAFNEGARQRCAAGNATFLDFGAELLNARGLPIQWYFFDTIHLSQRAMPLALRALARRLPEAGLPQLPVSPPSRLEGLADRFAKRLRRWLKQRPPLRPTRG